MKLAKIIGKSVKIIKKSVVNEEPESNWKKEASCEIIYHENRDEE